MFNDKLNETYKKNNLGIVITHLLVWSALLFFPLLLTSSDQPLGSYYYFKICRTLFFSAIIFYINYFFLIQQFLFKNRPFIFLLLNLVLIGLCLVGIEFSHGIFNFANAARPVAKGNGGSPEWKNFIKVRNSFSMLLTAGISVAIRSTQKWIHSEEEKKTLQTQHLISQLAHLKYQLQPHFFFNSLNSIYSLIDSNPENAKTMVHTLAKMMRYVLYETNGEKIPLSHEIGFIESYVKLVQIRFPTQVIVHTSFPTDSANYSIAPLLLVPLVENAFKHGVSSLQKSVIEISLVYQNSAITFKTINPDYKKDVMDNSGSGIGLVNLTKRLEILYPGNHAFQQQTRESLVITTLTIQL